MKPYIFIIGVFAIVAMLLIEMGHIQQSATKSTPESFDTASLQPVVDHSKIPCDSVQIREEIHADIVNEISPVFAEYKLNQRENNCDSLKRLNDSLLTQLFVAKYRVERVRYYIKICQHNPKQTKFLLSWVHRAVQ